jgi:YggT family protein
MDIILVPLIKVLMLVIDSFRWALIVYAILSWLIAFDIVNTQNALIHSINDILRRLIDPLLSPLRSILPTPGGLDLSFIVLFLIVTFLENMLSHAIVRFLPYMLGW